MRFGVTMTEDISSQSLPLFPRDMLVSIRPIYADKILSGEKTIELRRRFPEFDVIGSSVLIYSTSPVQAIVGHARIVDVHRLKIEEIWRKFSGQACIARQDFVRYFQGVDEGFAIQLGGVGKFDRPLTAVDLREEYGVYPPQSYRYVDDLQLELFSVENVQVSH